MKFLAISTNTGDPTPYIDAEAERTTELVRSGKIERMLLKADWSGAILLLSVDDREEAQALVDSLPIAANGLTDFTLTAVVEPPV
jgi:muconolactone delta-isomerase